MVTSFQTPVLKLGRNVDITFQLGFEHSNIRLSDVSPVANRMISLKEYHGLVVRCGVKLDCVADYMQDFGVFFAIVVDEAGRMRGVLDVADAVEERPMQVSRMQNIGFTALTVDHVMMPIDSIGIIDYDEVKRLSSIALYNRLRSNNQQYAIVCDTESQIPEKLHGIFSLHKLTRELRRDRSMLRSDRSFANCENPNMLCSEDHLTHIR